MSIVIFGASGGIGDALSRRLKRKGRSLFLVGRNQDKLKLLAAELDCGFAVADVTDSAQVEAALDQAGTIEGVAHCVGSILLKPAHLTSDADFDDTIRINLNSAFYVLRGTAKRMREKGGSIVLFSSTAARVGLVNHEAIAAAKSGVQGLVLSAAATYARHQIRINAIAPGLVRTPLAARITANENALKVSTAMHSLGRIGEPNDIASLADWLLDAEQTWITGQIIGVDGGLADTKIS